MKQQDILFNKRLWTVLKHLIQQFLFIDSSFREIDEGEIEMYN